MSIKDISANFEDEIFEEVYKKQYDGYKTVKELQFALNTPRMFDCLVDFLADNYDMEFQEAEDYIVDNNLLYKILQTENIVKLLENRLGLKTMKAHKTTPTKKGIRALENSVRRMF